MMNPESKLRKIAGKALFAILAVLLLCIFFSGTVKTLFSPKVKLAGVSSGRLRENIPLHGVLHFSETEEIVFSTLPDGITLDVTGVYVSPGQYVNAGEALFATEVRSFDEKLAGLTQRYCELSEQLILLQRQNVRYSRADEAWFAAYEKLTAAKEALLQAQIQGVESEEVWTSLTEQEAEAQAAFDYANRNGVKEKSLAHWQEKRQLDEQLAEVLSAIQELKKCQEQTAKVLAPHDGYIVSVPVRTGDTMVAKQTAIVISGQGCNLTLRADITDSSRKITSNMNVTMEKRDGSMLRSRVLDTGYDKDGRMYADVALDEQQMTSLSAVRDLIEKGVSLTLIYTAEETTMQLPVSAVRGAGDERYVYVVTEEENLFGSIVLKVQKKPVQLLDTSDTMAAVEGLSYDAQVAYMEDRTLRDGMEVTTYGSTP